MCTSCCAKESAKNVKSFINKAEPYTSLQLYGTRFFVQYSVKAEKKQVICRLVESNYVGQDEASAEDVYKFVQHRGVATCSADDVFDEAIGRKVAFVKALNKYQRYTKKMLNQTLKKVYSTERYLAARLIAKNFPEYADKNIVNEDKFYADLFAKMPEHATDEKSVYHKANAFDTPVKLV